MYEKKRLKYSGILVMITSYLLMGRRIPTKLHKKATFN
jgi:hypothetical protein